MTASPQPIAALWPGFDPDAAANAMAALATTLEGWGKAFQADFGGHGKSHRHKRGAPAAGTLHIAPGKFEQLQRDYMQAAGALWNESLHTAPTPIDRRFAGQAWAGNPWASFAAAAYLLNARALLALADAAEGDVKTRNRLRFAVEQWVAAAAPSNYLAFNPDALQKAIDTKGKSLVKGVQNMLDDLQRGHMAMTDEHQFEVGRNVATTEGAVVFENDYFQLIEYKPLTAKVYARPLLVVPPCINKYYIMDLQPNNSLLRYAVSQGHRTFVISWRNPDQSMAQATWDDYIEHAVLRAIDAVRDITGSPRINMVGFCVGGTLLGTALAVLAARGQQRVSSATFLTTFLDFSDTGVLDVFIDEGFVKFREMELGKGGLLKGQVLAATFSFLRPDDLVWNYVVGNYLKGETPPAFDLLYWNGDSTNLPGPFYTWYLRNTYLENNLVKPGKCTVCEEKIDLGKIDMPIYIYGSREDHIVPIDGAYASTRALSGPKRFVMGASGHIAGVINPPAANKRSHWLRQDDKLPSTLDAWLAGAKEYPGSWWPDWADWLKSHAGRQIAAPHGYGKAPQYRAIEPAPGRYVKVKA
ncbi:MAG: class I poly(R)-hydroxyalkanoic acid synthase [Burkholderiaceae bacterium]|nr:class I poly(R)-hydroxyalkanoic acid synthase [Burkholderiaceae bacterium]